jgi:cell fate regulator YaaT (PSP1 superfamily)
MESLFDIKLDNGGKYKARGEDSLNLKNGDWCVAKKEFYNDYGRIVQLRGPLSPEDKTDYPRIQRKATVVDQSKANENVMRAKSALRTASQYVQRLNLKMKLLNAHFSLDGKLITIQFTADGRVDFRELVKELARALNTRIELRQIGVRDETSILGGIAICGRNMCCCTYIKEFKSINVKMAKEQDLSLTPGTISGMCGRLKCCLLYEHEGYLELDRAMPRRGDVCDCSEGRGKIIDRNLLTQKVVVQLDSTGKNISCPKTEVTVVYPEKYKIPKPGEYEEIDEEIKKLEG